MKLNADRGDKLQHIRYECLRSPPSKMIFASLAYTFALHKYENLTALTVNR